MQHHLIAVDIGTGSARAGLFDLSGRLRAKAACPIALHRPTPDHAEHDSEDIWQAVCRAVRAALGESGVDPASVAALGFDATCSLVVRGADGGPVTVSREGAPRHDTIAWLDHRAQAEAAALSASGHPAVAQAGGAFSPEMQLPKLMWLKRHLPESWARATAIYDLADYMTFRATGSGARSVSTLAAKWNYRPDCAAGWDDSLLSLAGLQDLRARAALPERAVPLGAAVGRLQAAPADALGLPPGIPVAAGMVDAYAGALGLLADRLAHPADFDRHLALVAGTSSCVIRVSATPQPLPGFWGPYQGVALPGCWLVEGGQSAAGALLDHVVRMHAAGGTPTAERHRAIVARVEALLAAEGPDLAPRLHVLPDFHGNRAPLADPQATGVVSGLTLDTSFDGLCRLYWRCCVALALGLRHVVDALRDGGTPVETLHLAGGHLDNPLLTGLYADATGCVVMAGEDNTAVLLGTALHAAVAAGLHPDMATAGQAMIRPGRPHAPDPFRAAARERDYRRFLAMIRHRAELDRLE